MAYLGVERCGGVVTCTITNPPMNFMNHAMVRELDVLAREVETNRDDRVLVLTGGLDGVFITHYDVGELTVVADRAAGGEEREGPALIHTVFTRLERMAKPTVAALNGTAMGGGCELSLACDFRLMAGGPFGYGLPETGVGIIPGAGGTQRMARLVGVAKALDLILHGQVLSPAEALAAGLVHRVFPAAEFRAEAAAFAENLARRAPLALAAAKEAIRCGVELPLAEALALEQRLFRGTMRSGDARGAMRAYLQGAPYAFTGE